MSKNWGVAQHEGGLCRQEIENYTNFRSLDTECTKDTDNARPIHVKVKWSSEILIRLVDDPTQVAVNAHCTSAKRKIWSKMNDCRFEVDSTDDDLIFDIATTAHLVSFDVFDTLIARRVLRPTDIFVWMERHFSEPGFAAKRMTAEKDARQHYQRRGSEVSLEEIYDHLPKPLSITAAQEIEAEAQFTFAVPRVKSIVDRLRQEKRRVIAVSDIYMSSTQVEYLLKSCNLSIDKIYTSADLRSMNIGKYNGRMYEYICLAEGLDPRQIVHFGDNFSADVVNALANNINAVLLDQPHYRTSQSSRLQAVVSANAAMMSQSVIAGISSERVLCRPSNSGELDAIAFSVGGPIVAGVIADLNEKASSGQFDKLILLERDGVILKNALDALTEFGVRINFDYVSAPCSRRLAVFPLYAIHGYDRISSLFSVFGGTATLGQILDTLGLAGPQNSDRSLRGPIQEVIGAHAEYFLSVARAELDAIRCFFRNDILNDARRTHAWFDVGWALSSITALNEILEINQLGYCLGSNIRVASDTNHSAYLFTRGDPKPIASAVEQKVELVELFFSSTMQQAMFIDYSGGNPRVIRRTDSSEDRLRERFVQRTNQQIIDFVRRIAPFFGEIDAVELREANGSVLLTLLRSFNEVGANSLRGIVHDLGAGRTNWKPMGSYWK